MRVRVSAVARVANVGAVVMAAAGLALCAGCIASGRVESSGAAVLDLVARQTELTLQEYERDLQSVDAGRRQAVVASLAERVKRDGAETVDAHAAAMLEALEKIAADRQVARQRYEAAMDNLELLREVGGGLRRYSERLGAFNGRLQGLFGNGG